MKIFNTATIIAALSCALPSAGAESVEYFGCDFSHGIPEGMNVVDGDMQPLHYTMTQRGFASEDSWISLREEGTENYFAASASRFKTSADNPAGPASDWLVLPQIWVRGTTASLSWKSMIVNEQSSRGSRYEVRVSTTGNLPEDFSSTPLTVVEEDMEEWADHSLDLSGYAGQRVWLAFVNITENGEILGLDDISVAGDAGIAEITLCPGDYFSDVENGLVISGLLTATSDVPVTRFQATCEVAGQSCEVSLEDLNLRNGENVAFTFPLTLDIKYGESVDYVVRPTVNDVVFDALERHSTCLAFLPKRNVVIEEATGTWCMYCPLGTWAMEILTEKYPDNFIPIAVHLMEGTDPMALDNYANQYTFSGGAPSGWVDRAVYSTRPMVPAWINDHPTYTTMMGGFETLLLDRLDITPLAEVNVSADLSEKNVLDIDVRSRFPLDISNADYRLCLVLTEDHVWEPGYRQTNGYSGSTEDVGGYESLPRIITEDLEFNHVARAIYDDFNGIAGSVPSELSAGVEYSYERSVALPSNVLNPERLNIVAMLLDNTTGEVLNAATSRVATAGLSDMVSEAFRISRDAYGIHIGTSGKVSAEVYDIAGRLLAAGSADGLLSLPVDCKGMVVLKITTPDGTLVRKLK